MNINNQGIFEACQNVADTYANNVYTSHMEIFEHRYPLSFWWQREGKWKYFNENAVFKICYIAE